MKEPKGKGENKMELKSIILSTLLQKPYTRKNNMLLIEEVMRVAYGWDYNEDLREVPFGKVMQMSACGLLPNVETITRLARKIKAKHPNLR